MRESVEEGEGEMGGEVKGEGREEMQELMAEAMREPIPARGTREYLLVTCYNINVPPLCYY